MYFIGNKKFVAKKCDFDASGLCDLAKKYAKQSV